MSEPIAVAFVEVRPETDSFRANAEEELRSGLGDEVRVPGRLDLAGLPEARREVGLLTNDLREVSGQQLQFGGLAEATAQSQALGQNLQDAASVDLASGLQPAADQLTLLADQASVLSSEVSSPIVGRDFTQGLTEAATATEELSSQTLGLGNTLATTADVSSALIARYPQLAAGERSFAAATAESTAQVRVSANAEEDLIRVRSRRAQTVGPFRLAGVGLGVGTAIFAATRALGELSQELTVTGNEAVTFEGRVRNLGAALLSGDVVGAFKAVTENTRSFSAAQVVAIDTNQALIKHLEEAGIRLEEAFSGLGESRLAAAQTFTQVPQFLQTRIAAADLTGNETQQLAALEEADRILKENTERIRRLQLSEAEKNVALEEVFKTRRAIADQIVAISRESRPDILAPLVEAVTDARLSGDLQAVVTALQNEATALERAIASAKTNAADRRRFKDELAKVNRDIEATQDQIIAEQERHRQAMIDKRLAPTEEAILDAQIADQSTLPALRERARVINEILRTGIINGKKLTRDERIRLKNELVSVNAQIEAEQDAIIAEQERHASAMSQKQADADEAFISGLGRREQRLRNRQIIAQATAGLNDDIRVSEALQALYREQIRRARKTIEDKRLRDQTIAELRAELLREVQSERDLRRQQRRERIERQAESLDLDIQIAQANDNRAAEIRAHRAKIAFLKERIRNTREGTNQRKRLILELRQEQAAVRDLLKQSKDDADSNRASFHELAAAFLQERDRLEREFASNISSTTPGLVAPPPPDRATPPPRPPTRQRPADVPSPLVPRPGGQQGDQGAAAQRLRESGGAPASQGQLETLIAISRHTNQLLSDIRRGVGHQEAKTSRAMSQNSVVVGSS